MRTSLLPVLAAVVALGTAGSLGPAPAHAQSKAKGEDVVGTYDVRYEEVSSNCTQTSIALARGTLDIEVAKKKLTVDIQRFPKMVGSPGRGGKVRASSKIERSSIEGVDGKFSVAGKVTEGLIQLVFVAEYYVKGKPLCSQTWNVTGQKK